MDIKLIKKEDKKYPKQLKQIPNPPKQLYIVGNEDILENEGIAIIGSRCYTEYGEKYATKFAKGLAKQGLNIISGMAVGIDTFSHKGAETVAKLSQEQKHLTPKSLTFGKEIEVKLLLSNNPS